MKNEGEAREEGRRGREGGKKSQGEGRRGGRRDIENK